MARGPLYSGPIRETVDRLVRKRPPVTAEAALQELRDLFPQATEGLHVRTVARWLQQARGEPGQPWSSVGASADDAADVLGVLDVLMEGDPGATITTAEAAAIARIRRTVPLMPATIVYGFAQAYASAGDAAEHLDLSVAFARRVRRSGAGFRLDAASIAAHVRRHVDEWITRPLVFWAGDQDGGAAYVAELGRHAAAVTRGGRWHYLADEGSDRFTWFDSQGFGRLVIDTGKGALE